MPGVGWEAGLPDKGPNINENRAGRDNDFFPLFVMHYRATADGNEDTDHIGYPVE